MNKQDHIELAYSRYKANREAHMLKEAGALKTFGKAFGNRFMDSVKGGIRDIKSPFQLFKKDKGAFMDSIKQDDYLHQAGGSLLRPLKTNMGASGMRFDRFANLDDDAYNAITSAQPKMWGKMRSPFQSGDSHWYAGLDDAGKAALSQHRAMARNGADILPDQLDAARSGFLRNTVGKEMNEANPAIFDDYYKKYGQPGDGGWFAQEAGRRAGTVAGGLGGYAALSNLPFSGAEWAGGLSAVPGAGSRAQAGAMQGAADQMHAFRDKGFLERMGDAFNPDRVVKDLYSPENVGKGGIAHHYMYGPGKQEQIKGPGMLGYARELALPFFSGSALEQSVQSNGLRQFQKMGFFKEAGGRGKLLPAIIDTGLDMVRPSAATAGGRGKLLPAIIDTGLDMVRPSAATKAIPKKAPFVSKRVRKAPAIEPEWTDSTGTTYNPAGMWPGVKQRLGNAWDFTKEHPFHAGLAGVSLAGLPASFMGGRSIVNEGAYNAGYGAGSAGAAQTFADQNPFARFGAAAFPDMAMNRVMQQYPDLMSAYQRAGSRRGQPAGSRSNYNALRLPTGPGTERLR